jgi:hypothetical protein
VANFSFNADYTADNKPSLGFDPNDMSWKHQISGRVATQLTASPLGASSVYTQPSQDSTTYPQDNYVAGHVYTDQPGTLYLDVSSDNTNWDIQTSLPVTPNTPNFLPFTPIQGRYYRFRYVNGNAPQTVFRLEQIVCNQIGTNSMQLASAAIAVPMDLQAIYRVLAFQSTTPLGANGTYASGSQDGLNYRRITGRVYADQSGTLQIQHSDDGVTWDTLSSISVPGGTPTKFDEPLYCRYVQVKYVNGSTAQGAFRISGYLCVE